MAGTFGEFGLVKGRLFHPYQSFRLKNFLIPPNVNPGHEKGWWITVAGFALEAELKRSRFVILERFNWLAPLISVEKVEVLDHQQVVSFLSGIETTGFKTNRTVHIARLDENGEELSRGFVVFPQWLNDVDSQ